MIVSWSIINNEIDFIKDIVPYHLSWLDGMYILDTGSTDGTYEYLEEISSSVSNLIVEKYHTSYVPEYETEWEKMRNPFPEVEVRNHALDRVETLFKADWLVQLDGDEVFLPETRNIINKAGGYKIISHSTINPVCELNKHPIENRKGIKVYDPHARLWKPGQGIRFINNPEIGGKKQYHCIPVHGRLEDLGWRAHAYYSKYNKFIPDIIHFHLHWMYGKKVEAFYKGKNTVKKDIPLDQKENEFSKLLPELYWNRRREWMVK